MLNVERAQFTILDKSLKFGVLKQSLPNLKKVGKTGYECDSVPLLDMLEGQGQIKVTSWRESSTLSGNDEQVITDDGEIMWARVSGTHIKLLETGLCECLRCGHVQKVDRNPTKDYVCGNSACGGKELFRWITPLHLKKTPWKMPCEPTPTEPEVLFQEIVEFVKEHLVLPDARLYNIFSYWIMATWVANVFPSVPYLLLLGPRESGKTRALEILQELCYRAVRSSTITPPSVYRLIEEFLVTLLIDEAEMQLNLKFEQGRVLYAVLNAGYKAGDVAVRIGENDRKPETFDVFGFKALSSTRSFVPTLESRCLTFSMEQEKPKKLLVDGDRARELRGMLLWFRYNYLSQLPITVEELPTGRLTEMFIPLFTVQALVKPDGFDNLKKYTMEVHEQRKEEDRISLESTILDIIIKIGEELPEQQLILDEEGRVKEKRVFLRDIMERLGCILGEGFMEGFSHQRLGYLLKEVGIPRKKGTKGMYVDIEGSKGRIERLKVRYGLDGGK